MRYAPSSSAPSVSCQCSTRRREKSIAAVLAGSSGSASVIAHTEELCRLNANFANHHRTGVRARAQSYDTFSGTGTAAIGPVASFSATEPVRSLSGAKRTWRGRRQSVAPDPKRHFTTVIYRIAKGSFDHIVGAGK